MKFLPPAQAPPVEPGDETPPPDPVDGRALFASDILAILPAAAATAFWALSSLFYGAYFPSAWYPATVIAVILCPLLLAAGWRLPVGPASSR